MRAIIAALLYTCLSTGANAQDTAAISALREGDMRKLQFHEPPRRGSEIAFEDETGAVMTLADLQGPLLVVNFWATWCAPCRKEMPQLSQLQEDLGGDDFQVVTIATGRNPLPAMRDFFDEIGVENLPLYRDPNQTLARDFGVLGLPATLILNADGEEIGRLLGEADWSSESAKAIFAALAGS